MKIRSESFAKMSLGCGDANLAANLMYMVFRLRKRITSSSQ